MSTNKTPWMIIGNKSYANEIEFDKWLLECLIFWNEPISEIIFLVEESSTIAAMIQKQINLHNLNFEEQFMDFELETDKYQWKAGLERIKKMIGITSRLTPRRKIPKIIIFWQDALNEKPNYSITKAIEIINQKGFELTLISTDHYSNLDLYQQAMSIDDEMRRSVALLALHFSGEVIEGN